MPAQARVETARSFGQCPSCGYVGDLLVLLLTVETVDGTCRHNQATVCPTCALVGLTPKVKEALRPRDVLGDGRSARRASVKRSQRSERKAAEQIAGTTTPRSGGGVVKGDARNHQWMIEDKFTVHQSYRLTATTFRKALHQAAATGREAVLRITLGDGTKVAVLAWNTALEHLQPEEQC